ncbi:hypothetical protein HPS_0674 [Glaesserella parasuis 29755]|nr:hypothetical protein HPS_0674 [Glaesserella parasuis 29755]
MSAKPKAPAKLPDRENLREIFGLQHSNVACAERLVTGTIRE